MTVVGTVAATGITDGATKTGGIMIMATIVGGIGLTGDMVIVVTERGRTHRDFRVPVAPPGR